MPTADLAAQRALLKLADTDRQIDTARHRRDGLPEIAYLAEAAQGRQQLADTTALREVEVGDLDAAARKLDAEIESVSLRVRRDEERLASAAVAAKEAENLQREVESLARRKASLEDDALELMEQREQAESTLASLRGQAASLETEIAAATIRRDAQQTAIDDDLARLSVQRAALVAEVPGAVLGVYDRIRAAGKVAAAGLSGDRCGGCGMALDKASLDELRTAAADEVPRCPECGALLVRNP